MSLDVTSGADRAAHVLGLCDLSPDAINAAWRAALVAHELRVPMRLLYRDPRPGAGRLPPSLASFIAEVTQRLRLDVTPIAIRKDPLTECVAHAKGGLLVIPTPGGDPLRERLLGSPAERLIRLARAPVLVVKQPVRGSYRRVFVPVDLEPHSDRLLATAARLSRGSSMAVFHALAPSAELVVLRELEAPASAWRAHRSERANSARTRLERLIATDGRKGSRAVDNVASLVPVVGFGPAADAILAGESSHQSELIVIGKRRHGLLANFLLGKVTRQVIARAQADVLVLPLPPEKREARVPDGRSVLLGALVR